MDGRSVQDYCSRGSLPVIAAIVAATGTWLVYRIAAPVAFDDRKHGGFRKGTNCDRLPMFSKTRFQRYAKTMGVIFLALVKLRAPWNNDDAIPMWVKASCAATLPWVLTHGWRIIRTPRYGHC